MKDYENEFGDFMSKSQAAKFASASQRSIDKWREKYGLKCIKIGNYIRFEKAVLLDFLRNHQQMKNQNQAQRQEGGEV